MSAYKLNFASCVQLPATLREEDTFLRAIALVPKAFRSPEDREQQVRQKPHPSPISLFTLSSANSAPLWFV